MTLLKSLKNMLRGSSCGCNSTKKRSSSQKRSSRKRSSRKRNKRNKRTRRLRGGYDYTLTGNEKKEKVPSLSYKSGKSKSKSSLA